MLDQPSQGGEKTATNNIYTQQEYGIMQIKMNENVNDVPALCERSVMKIPETLRHACPVVKEQSKRQVADRYRYQATTGQL